MWPGFNASLQTTKDHFCQKTKAEKLKGHLTLIWPSFIKKGKRMLTKPHDTKQSFLVLVRFVAKDGAFSGGRDLTCTTTVGDAPCFPAFMGKHIASEGLPDRKSYRKSLIRTI
jgi:hypothetical protein